MNRLRRTFLPAVFALIACLVFAQLSGAWWSNSGGGSTTAGTATVPAGNAPTVSLAGTTVTVNVSQISVAGQLVGVLGGSYTVKRYPANGGAAVTPGGSCGASVTGAAAVLSCTETSTPRGDWRYTVSPTLFQWTGAESPTSATVTIAPDPASGLTATAAPAGAINLSWTAGAGATGYNVYRRTTAGAYNFTTPVNGATPVGGTTYSDTTAVSGTAYNYVVRSTVIGSAGQQIASGNSNETAAVTSDATVPTGVTLNAVATPMRANVTLSGAASDTISGLANVTFQYKLSAGSTWLTGCSDTSAPFSCNFDTTTAADGLYDFRSLATDNVGNTATSTIQTNRRIDNTAPIANATDPGAYVRGNVVLGGTATDAGSGIASLQLEGRVVGAGAWDPVCTSATSPLNCPFDTLTVPDGLYEIQLIATDSAGNQTTTPTVGPITVDNTAPTVTMTDPGAAIGGVVPLASTTTDATGIATVLYQYKTSAGAVWNTACTGSTTPFTCNFNTVPLAAGLYDFRAIATDLAGNQTTSAAVTGRRVDNTPPTGVTITAPPTPIRGTITINAGTPLDTGGSGVASVAIQHSPAGTGTWTSVCTDTAAAYSCSFNSTLVADGLYDFRALATDNAGNTAASAIVTNRRIDNTAPTVALTDPGTPLRATVALDAAATDTGSGMASVAFQYKLSAAATWTTISTDTTTAFTASFNTAVLNGTYDIRAMATDVAGNQSTSQFTNIVIDNTVPTATDIQTADGVGVFGRPDAGDTVTYTFSEAMRASSFLAGWTGASQAISLRLNQGGQDTMTVFNAANTAQLPFGSVRIGRNHVTASAVFNATMTMSGNTIVITLGTQLSGTVATSATNVTMRWTPSAAALDLAGNPMATTNRNETGGGDREF